MPTWDLNQCLQFERERTQPCIELVNRIDTAIPNTSSISAAVRRFSIKSPTPR